MRTKEVEVYSDTTNAAVLRHPDRKFPGCLIQGDTLNGLAQSIRRVRRNAHQLDSEVATELCDVADHLETVLAHYRAVLVAHDLDLPFADRPDD